MSWVTIYTLHHVLTTSVYFIPNCKYSARPGNGDFFSKQQHSSGPQRAHRQDRNERDRQGTSKLQYVLRKNEAETSNQTGMLGKASEVHLEPQNEGNIMDKRKEGLEKIGKGCFFSTV